MRKIESDMLAAIAKLGDAGRNASLSMGSNTIVTFSEPRPEEPEETIRIYLHGNLIAILSDAGLLVSLAGWNTATTRSRLSALIRGLADARSASLPPMTADDAAADAAGPYRCYPAGLGVSTRKGAVRIHDARGETVIDATGWHTVEL